MKAFAHYDAKGTVRALVTVQGPGNINASLVPKPGHMVAEIEDLLLDPAKTADPADLRSIAKELKIVPARAARAKK